MTIHGFLTDPQLLGPQFADASWRPWRDVALPALFGLPIAPEHQPLFERCTGRRTSPTMPAREGWFIVGRRAGKSRVMAAVAVFLATCRRYQLAPGERGVLMLIAADRRQARVLRRYVGGFLQATPLLRRLIERETDDAIGLSNGIDIEIHTASFRAVRGYTVVAAVCDEIAFWHTDDAANPDTEILNALRPALATVPGALLIAISSPYARRGELWRAYERHHGRDESDVVVWQADTRTMNPNVPAAVIDRAYAEDAAVAAAEYGAQFRSDLESFVSRDVLGAVTVPGRLELPPAPRASYHAFVDPAGGSGRDSMTLAIASRDVRGDRAVAVLAAIREVKPPFSPEAVVAEFAAVLGLYRVTHLVGDAYAGDWPREAFARHGISYTTATRTKGDIYRDALPLINSSRCELLAVDRLRDQVLALERRTGRAGRDAIDHRPSGHDDLANAALGALLLAGDGPAWSEELTLLAFAAGDDEPRLPTFYS